MGRHQQRGIDLQPGDSVIPAKKIIISPDLIYIRPLPVLQFYSLKIKGHYLADEIVKSLN